VEILERRTELLLFFPYHCDVSGFNVLNDTSGTGEKTSFMLTESTSHHKDTWKKKAQIDSAFRTGW
jgi:hypothetical protein